MLDFVYPHWCTVVTRSVEVTVGPTKIKLVYGADPRVGNKTVSADNVYVFDGGLMSNTGVMITISLDVGVELTWDTSIYLCLSVCLSVCPSVLLRLCFVAYVYLCLRLIVGNPGRNCEVKSELT